MLHEERIVPEDACRLFRHSVVIPPDRVFVARPSTKQWPCRKISSQISNSNWDKTRRFRLRTNLPVSYTWTTCLRMTANTSLASSMRCSASQLTGSRRFVLSLISFTAQVVTNAW